MKELLVNKKDLRDCRVEDCEAPAAGDGEALLRVDTFGLTANNITYAVFGEAMNYWDFFPTSADGWGRVPMWGFAEVAESNAAGLEPGGRLYGYHPPAESFVVKPERIDERGFVDASPHRSHLPSAYHAYLLSGTDPFYDAGREELQMLLRPLFFTSFMLDDELADGGLRGADRALFSSASSKTAIGTAYLLAQREGIEIVGLTSPRSVEFVEGLGIYDRVVAYPDLESVGAERAAYVDFAGDGPLRGRIHRQLADNLTASVAVGATSWEGFSEDPGELPGPAPRLFFAPDRVVKRSSNWGRAELEKRCADAWHPFMAWVGEWLGFERAEGMDAVRDAYLDVIEGNVPPDRAHVLTL